MSSDLGCVIVAVDGCEESMDALRLEINNLKLRSPAPGSTEPPNSFIVLHVQPPPTIAASLNPGTIPSSGPRSCGSSCLYCSHKSAVNVKSKVVIGDAREKVCELVEKLHADLLVMGSHTFGPIKRYICPIKHVYCGELCKTFWGCSWGSINNFCANHAQCPVVVVKRKGISS